MSEILRDHGLLVLGRTGVAVVERIAESPLLAKHADAIHLFDDVANPNVCSSTKIRQVPLRIAWRSFGNGKKDE